MRRKRKLWPTIENTNAKQAPGIGGWWLLGGDGWPSVSFMQGDSAPAQGLDEPSGKFPLCPKYLLQVAHITRF